MSRAVLERTLTLLIADDDSEFRELVRRILEGQPRMRVVAEAGDGEEAVRLAGKVRPQVVLMDIAMPRMNGLEAIRRTKAELPGVKIIAVTVHGEQGYRRAALECGADAFILKKSLGTELLPTIRRVVSS